MEGVSQVVCQVLDGGLVGCVVLGDEANKGKHGLRE